MISRAISLFLLAFAGPALAVELSIGGYRADQKVQDRKGKESTDPISPYLAIGFSWNAGSFGQFTPRIGYIQNSNRSDDFYASYTIETMKLLYDFSVPIQGSSYWSLRYGVGSFIQRIRSQGGAITVPNGNSTMTAYKPSGVKDSATATLNLGFDYRHSAPGSMFDDLGLTGEIFYFDPFSRKSIWAHQLGLVKYF